MDKWFVQAEPATKYTKKSTVFLFPYAGGGVSSFKNWGGYFKHSQLYYAQYPGRENRFCEKAIDDIFALVEGIFQSMRTFFNFSTPYYLFGYSMGTKVVYELAVKIREYGLREPEGLIVSAGRAPCLKEPNPIYNLDDDGFIDGLRRYESTPQEILDNRELMEIFLPTLRADFIIAEGYRDKRHKKIGSDILALMGKGEEEMRPEDVNLWAEYTTGSFNSRYIDGKHMFIKESEEDVIRYVREFVRD